MPFSAKILVIPIMLAAIATASADGPTPASLAGIYDGSQTEVAARLELTANGHFRYELSYGALDEEASGRWTTQGGQVFLTSDPPVKAPRIVLVSQSKGADGVLDVKVDGPQGLDQQYFDALIVKSDGQTDQQQLSSDGLSWSFTSDKAPTSIRLVFPVYEVASDALKLDPSAGYALHYRFEPNDLGKADFRATPLKIVNGVLELARFGETLRFKRTKR
jgi:hypothetical protein